MRSFHLHDFPVFASLAMDAGLKAVDIGGRGSAMPHLISLAEAIDYYICEPDREEAERLREDLPRRAAWRSVTVIPEAIASGTGERTLFVTRSPGMSSLREPDPDVSNRFCLGSRFRVVNTVGVPTMTLDGAANQYGFHDACFLKLDTQGTELEILQSGRSLVERSVVGIYVEALFHPFYRGQSLFSDVDSYLRRCGFTLFSLNRTMLRRSRYRDEMYSRRMIAWAHCFYLREADSARAIAPTRATTNLARLIILAVIFQHFDFAIELLAGSTSAFLTGTRARELGDEIDALARQHANWLKRKAGGAPKFDILSGSLRDGPVE
jgi:FkbM family methyltransferase